MASLRAGDPRDIKEDATMCFTIQPHMPHMPFLQNPSGYIGRRNLTWERMSRECELGDMEQLDCLGGWPPQGILSLSVRKE